MFDFIQDIFHLLPNGDQPNNLLQQALLRAEKMRLEQGSDLRGAFDTIPLMQTGQMAAGVGEFYRLLEIFFSCVLKTRNRTHAQQEGGGGGGGRGSGTTAGSSRVVWPPPPLHSLSQPPQTPLPRGHLPNEDSREKVNEVTNKSEFGTPALNSLIEMTLSKTYQLGNSDEIPKAKHTQKHVLIGAAMTPDLGTESSVNMRAPKRRKTRTTFTSFQLAELEVYFSKQKYLTPADRDQIAGELGLSSTQVITWFQNRRAKKKRECAELERDILAAKRNREKTTTFLFDVPQLPPTLTHSSVEDGGFLSVSPSSPTVPTHASSSTLFENSPTKAEFSVPSLAGCEPQRPDPKPIWRPISLEDTSKE
ncbi:unnamed protein product [Mesocestoides corti]|uniref:Homeobox domain-containing protein n=1 Tax=Mesocestoides corti TaxID=53468 RepID=A0A0R3UDY9_MESCO|nr:unnamed protein product [Mesocestoides corti]